jgi:DNA-binding beta-propeller fold protein YncE
MSSPSGLYSDGTFLYVADTGNNRLLLFKKIPTMNGWHADVVIGQDGFKDSKPNRGQKASDSSFKSPENIFITDGRLYVCDTGNNRILFFNMGKDLYSAEGVIGQTNFKTSGLNAPNGIPTSYTLYNPTSIFVREGILYVSDKGNNRVLIY